MSECDLEGCRHHAVANRYQRRNLLCRLSVHRHWGDAPDSPPPWHDQCLECGYDWVRTLNGQGERLRFAWWWKAPWFIRSPLLWLSHRDSRWFRVESFPASKKVKNE